MDKNAIKKYAVWARRELIARVSQRAALYEITDKGYGDASADSVLGRVMSAEEKRQRQALIAQIREKGYEQVIEEIAYTWFNRFAALRFMEVNGYLPTHIRVFTDDENGFKPQILAEAINMELDGLDMEKVYALKNANDDDALFKYMIIVQCNALSSILPGMFQRISDFTELLFPDNLLRDGSVIEQMVTTIPEEDWTDQVQIIGWLYQYYNTEPKDKVFADLQKNIKITKENIPAATQLFTPDWIVRYMVENSLGRLWLEGHPNDGLKASWKYYLDEAEQDAEVESRLYEIRKDYAALKPEDILVIDPCQGSGHILAYMFDVLVQIYESYGYTAREAASSIVEHNIWGLDIDDRAAQLAYFSVMMKARQYDRRFFSRGIQPHVYAIQESNGFDPHCVDYFVSGRPELKSAVDTLVRELHDAKEYGSILDITQVDFEAIYARIEEIRNEATPNVYSYQAVESILPMVQVGQALAQKYDVVVTNPPYMGSSNMNSKLSSFCKANYELSREDLFAVFIDKCNRMLRKNGLQAMITMHSWMFLSSFEKLRRQILKCSIVNLIHFGSRAFDNDVGTIVQSAAFVIKKANLELYKGTYCDVTAGNDPKQKEAQYLSGINRYYISSKEMLTLPSAPVAYWVSENLKKAFLQGERIDKYIDTFQGIITGDNDKFLRYWYEVNIQNVSLHSQNMDSIDLSQTYWLPYNKGGSTRKWYGVQDYVINWRNGPDDKTRGRNTFAHFYLREYASWSYTVTDCIPTRFYPCGFLWDVRGSGLMPKGDMLYYLMGLISSRVGIALFKVNNSTLSCQVENILQLPIYTQAVEEVTRLVIDNIRISKEEWDSYEESWDFVQHPLVKKHNDTSALFISDLKISDLYDAWSLECSRRFDNMKSNEEEINRIFIRMYGLEEELNAEESDKEVTIRRADLHRDIRSLVSYAVGCMFGRYSLDEDGLVFAGGTFNPQRYKSFPVDRDGILPICDDDYFDDDITSKLILWVKTVYGDKYLDENLSFIASGLGGKGSPRDVIRNYFLNDFYSDHLKTYSKRPIYWMFDSGKKNGFKCLVYLHRYAPDTIARIRTDYVHEQQSRYRTAIEDFEKRIDRAETSERLKLSKRLGKVQEQAEELRVFEERVHHLADQMIQLDLDEGVKNNYLIFQDVLAKVK